MITRRTALAGIAALAANPLHAQDGLTLKSLNVGSKRIRYLARLAGEKKAPMLLCFGGGDANRGIAEYYDQVYTPETLYQDHHVILPIGLPRRRFFQFTNKDAREMIAGITAREPIEGRGLISGVSNGGRAAFTFARAAPGAFRGLITMPGAIGSQVIPRAWNDYAMVLAYGTQDPRWASETRRTVDSLRGKVGAIEQVPLTGQGHVVGPDYDIDPVYARRKLWKNVSEDRKPRALTGSGRRPQPGQSIVSGWNCDQANQNA